MNKSSKSHPSPNPQSRWTRVSTKENPIVLDADKTYLEQLEEDAMEHPEALAYLKELYKDPAVRAELLGLIPRPDTDDPSAPPSVAPGNQPLPGGANVDKVRKRSTKHVSSKKNTTKLAKPNTPLALSKPVVREFFATETQWKEAIQSKLAALYLQLESDPNNEVVLSEIEHFESEADKLKQVTPSETIQRKLDVLYRKFAADLSNKIVLPEIEHFEAEAAKLEEATPKTQYACSVVVSEKTKVTAPVTDDSTEAAIAELQKRAEEYEVEKSITNKLLEGISQRAEAAKKRLREKVAKLAKPNTSVAPFKPVVREFLGTETEWKVAIQSKLAALYLQLESDPNNEVVLSEIEHFQSELAKLETPPDPTEIETTAFPVVLTEKPQVATPATDAPRHVFFNAEEQAEVDKLFAELQRLADGYAADK